jgi:hypothetical protein
MRDGFNVKGVIDAGGFKKCTETCAEMHRFLCTLIKSVKLTIQKFETNFE